jgi:hypothetical protein
MNLTRLAIYGAGAFSLGAVIFGGYQFQIMNGAEEALANSVERETGASAGIAALEARLSVEGARAIIIERDNELLKSAIQKARIASANKREDDILVTRDVVKARFDRGKELRRNGNDDAALKELLWCFDVGMPAISSYGGVRASYLLDEIAALGSPGMIALHERRDKARQRVLEGDKDGGATGDLSSLSRKLNDSQAILVLLDQLPPGEARRSLAIHSFRELVAARRYSDAILARPFSSMNTMFELTSNTARGRMGDHGLSTVATNIEVLAGAGNFDQARSLLTRLLKQDNSESTKVLLRRHLERAGHSELMDP